MAYYVATPDPKERVREGTLKDAYRTAAAILLGQYRVTNGNVHKTIAGYTGSIGIPIYDSATGKACNHWVRFSNGSNPKDGYDEVVYDKRFGVATHGRNFPKNW